MQLFIFLVVILFMLIVSAMSIYSFFIGAPILFSPKKAITEALVECKAKPGENFYDLGSGTGRTMLVAAKKFKLNIYGFELSPPIAFISKCNFWLNGIGKSKIYVKNFYNEDLSNADIIFCFLSTKAMRKLKSKFEKELKPGTRIISYAFHLPDWEPKRIAHNGNPGKTFLYVKK